jgi:hypothetical protein
MLGVAVPRVAREVKPFAEVAGVDLEARRQVLKAILSGCVVRLWTMTPPESVHQNLD